MLCRGSHAKQERRGRGRWRSGVEITATGSFLPRDRRKRGDVLILSAIDSDSKNIKWRTGPGVLSNSVT